MNKSFSCNLFIELGSIEICQAIDDMDYEEVEWYLYACANECRERGLNFRIEDIDASVNFEDEYSSLDNFKRTKAEKDKLSKEYTAECCNRIQMLLNYSYCTNTKGFLN